MNRRHPVTMDPLASRRPMPNDPRAWIMRAAGTMIGPERLAKALGISPRSIYWMMAGRRAVNDGVLRDTGELIRLHRQAAGAIGQRIRDELGSAGAPEPVPADRREAARAAAAMLQGLRS